MNTLDKNHKLRSEKVQNLIDQQLPWFMKIGILIILLLIIVSCILLNSLTWKTYFFTEIEIKKKKEYLYHVRLRIPESEMKTLNLNMNTSLEVSNIKGVEGIEFESQVTIIDSLPNKNREGKLFYVTLQDLNGFEIHEDSILSTAVIAIRRPLSHNIFVKASF